MIVCCQDGHTALFIAVNGDLAEIIELLLNASADTNFKTKLTRFLDYVRTVSLLKFLLLLFQNEHVLLFDQLTLDRHSFSMLFHVFYFCDQYQEKTALLLAVEKGNVAMVQFLLNYGVDVNGKDEV